MKNWETFALAFFGRWKHRPLTCNIFRGSATCENVLQLGNMWVFSENDHLQCLTSRAAWHVTRRCCGVAILRNKPPSHATIGRTASERMHVTYHIKKTWIHIARKFILFDFWKDRGATGWVCTGYALSSFHVPQKNWYVLTGSSACQLHCI